MNGRRHGCWLGLALATLAAGCTGVGEYVRNGFKVGPNYWRPAAPVADKWIDALDQRVRTRDADHAEWWTVFHDATLDRLVREAYRQNLSVRVAGLRVLEARAQRAVAAGNLFPQTQQAFADYTRHELSRNIINQSILPERSFGVWEAGFNLAWELDFWGRFRRAIESADAALEASADHYDDVLVTLVADVAAAYVTIRTLERRLENVRENLAAQKKLVDKLDQRFQGKVRNAEIDYPQNKANYELTASLVPALETQLRQANNQLCILLGIPPRDLRVELSVGRIPRPVRLVNGKEVTDYTVAAGIPGEVLLRRPDVRRAERNLAAQSAQIGIAAADLYPRIAVTGIIGIQANQFKDLFDSQAFASSFGPSLQWNILNYGRLLSQIRVQDARFQQLAVIYQETVLKANLEAENALVAFLQAQNRLEALAASARDAVEANRVLQQRDEAGKDVDFNQWFNVQVFKTQVQDQAAQAEADVAQSLIQLYRALGGGWQLRQQSPHAGIKVVSPGSAPPHLPPHLPPPSSVRGPQRPVPAVINLIEHRVVITNPEP